MDINSVRAGTLYTGGTGQRNSKAKGTGAESFPGLIKDAGAKAEGTASEEGKDGQEENLLKTTEEMMRFIRERKQEIIEKVRKGEIEVKIRVGAQEFTQKEWDKLIESFDEAEDDIRKKLREAREQQRKAMAGRANAGGDGEEAAEDEEALIEKLLTDNKENKEVFQAGRKA